MICKCSLLTGFYLAFSAAAWGETTTEAQVLSTFESYCLMNANYPSALPELLMAKGATETGQFKDDLAAPPIAASFKALLTPLAGRSFKLKENTSVFLFSVTDTGACSLSSREAKGDFVEALLKARMATRQIGKESSGTTIHATYAVSFAMPVGVLHALVFIDRPVRDDGSGIRLSSLADQFLRARVQREPEWPVVPLGMKAP